MNTQRTSPFAKRFSGSLFARIFLVTVFALISFVAIFFVTFRSTLIFPAAIESLAEPISRVIEQTERAAAGDESAILDLFASATRIAEIQAAFPEGAAPSDAFKKRLMKSSSRAKKQLAGRDVRFRYLNPRAKRRAQSTAAEKRFPAVTALEVSVELREGQVLIILFSPASVIVDRPGLVGLLFAFASIFIGVITAAGIRFTLKPLSELETSAERFGSSFHPEPIQERGPEEIRRLARALNRTQEQVRSLLAERARMISALAHDVLTSLTRLRLRVENLKSSDGEAMTQDIDLLEILIDDMLTYAKSGEPNHPVELIDMINFIKEYTNDLPHPLPLQKNGAAQEFFIAADPNAITRVLNNLIDNAINYGGGANIICEHSDSGLMIHIDDDGPGIPENQLTKVLEPFYRLEGSRSRQTGGSGMGLGIASSLLRAMGGQLVLKNRRPSGLRATLFFPAELEIIS